MNTEELERLHQLKEKGAITEEEFQEAKERIFTKKDDSSFDIPTINLDKVESQKSYVTFLHLSVLLGSFVPWLGYVVPFVMWYSKKDSIPRVDRHGRVVLNWILTSFIFSIISFVLIIFFGLGILLLGILWLANIVFSIIGALKANDGVLWPYPGSFDFLKVKEDPNSSQQV